MRIFSSNKRKFSSAVAVVIFSVLFLGWANLAFAKVPVVVLGEYLNMVYNVKRTHYFLNNASYPSGDWVDMGTFFYKSLTEKSFDKDEWSKVAEDESLKNAQAKFWHNAVMERSDNVADKFKWEEGENQKEITQDFSTKETLLQLLQNGIMASVKEADDGEKYDLAWLEKWKPEKREQEGLKDFYVDLFEEALMRAKEKVHAPDQDTDIKDQKQDKVREKLSKATLKEFLLYLKDSQEQFFYDFTQNMWGDNAEKIWEEYKTYELAKIEKAREDVGKLTYETMKELKEEPTTIREIKAGIGSDVVKKQRLDDYVRTLGLKLSSVQDCPWGVKVEQDDSDEGQCVVIKESGRMIRDVDKYVHEEAYKKARDFVMCYLAPWRHFPFGRGGVESKKDWDIGRKEGWCPQDPSDPSDYYRPGDVSAGATCDPKKFDDCKPKCSSEFICAVKTKQAGKRPEMFSPGDKWKKYKKKLCPSDQQKEELKRSLIFELARRRDFLDTMPPEEWYYGEPNFDTSFMAAAGGEKMWWNTGMERCSLVMEYIPGSKAGREKISEYKTDTLKGVRARAFAEWEEVQNDTDLRIQKGEGANFGRSDPGYISRLASPFTSPRSLKDIIFSQTDRIVNSVKTNQALKYQAGEGIDSKYHLIGWKPDKDDEKKDDVYTINTGKIISPAKILTSKLEAAQKAQFDLAMKSWKKQPEGYEETEWSCPEPSAGEIEESEYEELECGAEGDKKMERKWYKVELEDPVDEKDPRLKYECKYPVFNELTCRKFGDFETEVARYTNFEELPHELPAPSEDPGEYAKVPESYMSEADNEGKREPPPDFRRDSDGEGDDKAYKEGLWKEFPGIYGETGEDGPYPREEDNVPKLLGEKWGKNRSSERYYLNKFYKDINQLYEKPMSQVMCEWFVGEDMISKDGTKSTIFQDDSKLKNIIYDYCLPTIKDDYESLEEPKEGKVPTEE